MAQAVTDPSTSPGASHGHASSALASAGAFVLGFMPWIVYWILVGNASFITAVLVALVLSLCVNLLAVFRGQPLMVLEVGTAAVFALFVVFALTLSDNTLERWLQPLGNAGLFAIVLISIMIGKPFTLQYAKRVTPREVWNEPGFVYVCRLMAWMWAATMGFMTLVSAIPPIVDGDATIRDEDDVLSVVCYWVLPFVALGLAMLVTSKYPDWFVEASGGEDDAPTTGTEASVPLAVPADDAGAVRVAVEPADVLVDETARVRVTGVPAGATVMVGAETIDGFGHHWRSTATCAAGDDGTLDLATASPLAGTWDHPDANAIVWSMAFASEGDTPDIFIPPRDPAVTIVTAAVDGRHTHATFVRRSSAADVEVHDVRAPGVVGRLFVPAGADRLPAVALFPGSEGGLDSQGSNAALLASRGCLALVAATFSGDGPPLDGVPARLERVPLERYGDAVRWLADHERVDPARVSAMSISRGSEGLLAAASRLDDVPLRSIVAVSPSSATWVGLGEEGSLVGIPAWTLAGDDLPAVQTDDRAILADIARQAIRRRGRRARFGPALLHLSRSFEPRIDDAEVTGAAAIEVERITAPLLLAVGGRDGVWPSTVMAQRLLERRRAAGVAAADQLLSYPDAGHLIRLGLWPTGVTHTGSIDLGGTAAGLAAAQADLTPRAIAFLTAP